MLRLTLSVLLSVSVSGMAVCSLSTHHSPEHLLVLFFLIVKVYIFMLCTGCSEKMCFFFTIHCNPSLAYIAVKDLLSFQCNASAQSLLLAGNFLYNQ